MAVVVITGASSGIGEATAIHLAGMGHKLVLAARRADRLETLAAQLSDRTELLVVPTDVSVAADLEFLARQAHDRFGAIDVWINNAGVGGERTWWEMGPGAIEQLVAINLTAPLMASRAVLPYMRRAGRGHIINVGSVAGHIGVMGAYTATKFGVRGLTEAMRREFHPFGIHVSLITPGYIRTEMTAAKSFKMPGPEIVAKAIAGVIRRPRREVVVPWWYRFAIALNVMAPWLTDRILGSKPKTN